MIAKLETGNGFGGALRYDVRAGKGTPKELARVLDASGVSFDFDDKGDILINPKQVGFDFRQQTMGYTGEGVIRKPVYHWVLSYHPDDKVSEGQMVEDAKEFLQCVGFDGTQYVMTVHYDKDHHHLHMVTNIVNNQGGRISTKWLIDRAHEAAAAITKDRGYTWGERTKQESITKEKIHDPHDRARKIIEPVIREAKDRAASLDEFKKILESRGISCKITLARDGKRGGISYAYEYEGMVHPFRGSSVGRELSFSYICNAIKANRLKAEKEKYEDIRAGFNATIPHVANELISIRNNCYRLYRDVSDAGIAVKTETAGKYDELRAVWQQFRELNETRKNATDTDTVRKMEVLGGMLMLLNPIVGLSVIFLAGISEDVRQSSQLEQKKQLLHRIESVRKEIADLAVKKTQLDIKKSECLKDYLDAKRCYAEYNDGLQELDNTIYDTQMDILKQEYVIKVEQQLTAHDDVRKVADITRQAVAARETSTPAPTPVRRKSILDLSGGNRRPDAVVVLSLRRNYDAKVSSIVKEVDKLAHKEFDKGLFSPAKVANIDVRAYTSPDHFKAWADVSLPGGGTSQRYCITREGDKVSTAVVDEWYHPSVDGLSAMYLDYTVREALELDASDNISILSADRCMLHYFGGDDSVIGYGIATPYGKQYAICVRYRIPGDTVSSWYLSAPMTEGEKIDTLPCYAPDGTMYDNINTIRQQIEQHCAQLCADLEERDRKRRACNGDDCTERRTSQGLALRLSPGTKR